MEPDPLRVRLLFLALSLLLFPLAGVADAAATPTYHYDRMEIHRWWNDTHDPNIDGPAARRLTRFLNVVTANRIAAYAQAVSGSDLIWHWQGVANCESGNVPTANTGNGYYGAYQFSLSTWHSVGGSGYPHESSLIEQTRRADILRRRSGLGQWPRCGSYYR